MAAATMTQCSALTHSATQRASTAARAAASPSASAFFRPAVRFSSPARLFSPQIRLNPGVARAYYGNCNPGGQAFWWGMRNMMNDPAVQQMVREMFGVTPGSKEWDSFNSAKGDMVPLAVDVTEEGDAYHVVADLPGLSRDDIKVQVSQEDRTLTISGERKRPQQAEDDSRRRRRAERRFGKFLRKLNLPADAELTSVNASTQDGVLTVRIARTPPPQPADVTDVPVY